MSDPDLQRCEECNMLEMYKDDDTTYCDNYDCPNYEEQYE